MDKSSLRSWFEGRMNVGSRRMTRRSVQRQALLEALENRALMAVPSISGLTVSPVQVTQPAEVTITATGVSDADGNNTISKVEFYVDTNLDGDYDLTDVKLGQDTNGADGWSLTVASDTLPSRTAVALLARAFDSTDPSAAAKTYVDVQTAGAPIARSFTEYLGKGDGGFDLVTDADGNVYVVGSTTANGGDVFVSKFTASGDVVWQKTLGGIGNEDGFAIAISSDGTSLAIAGRTNSNSWSDINSLNNRSGSDDGFAAKLSTSDGAVDWHMYLGGTADEEAYGVAFDSNGDLFVVGWTASDGWITGASLSGTTDGFLVKIKGDGTQLLRESLIGGLEQDYAKKVAVDAQGRTFVGGRTNSPNSNNWVSGGYDLILNNDDIGVDGQSNTFFDGFVAAFDTDGTPLWSTFVGGTGAVESVDDLLLVDTNLFVLGNSSAGGWVSDGFNNNFGDGTDMFIAKLGAAAGTHVWSAFIGGEKKEEAQGLGLDPLSGSILVVGATNSANLQVNALYSAGGETGVATDDDLDGLIVSIDPSGSGAVNFATYFGGDALDQITAIATDSIGRIFVTGKTNSTNLEKGHLGSISTGLIGESDAFLAKFGLPITIGSVTTDKAQYFTTETITITANDVAASNSSQVITAVQFWLDENGNGFVDAEDVSIGNDTDGSNGWTAQILPDGPNALSVGTYTVLVRATDGDVLNDATSKEVTVKPFQLVIGDVSFELPADNRPVKNSTITVKANNTTIDVPQGLTPTVKFYLDVDNSGTINQGDTELGTDNNGTDGYSITVTTIPVKTNNKVIARMEAGSEQGAPVISADLAVQDLITFTRTLPLIFTDANGDVVTIRLNGAGTVKAYFNAALASNTVTRQPLQLQQNVQALVLESTDPNKSSLSVTVARGGRTTIENIKVNGSLGAINAAPVDGLLTLDVTQMLKSLKIGDMTAGTIVINLSAPNDKVKFSLSGNSFVNTTLKADNVALSNINVTQWISSVSGDEIKARSLDNFTTRGDTKKSIAGDAQLDITLTGGAAVRTLGSANIKDDLADSSWNVTGLINSVAANTLNNVTIHAITQNSILGVLNSLTLRGVPKSPNTPTFTQSSLLADSQIKNVRLGLVNPGNANDPFGTYTPLIGRISLRFNNQNINKARTVTLTNIASDTDLANKRKNPSSLTLPQGGFDFFYNVS